MPDQDQIIDATMARSIQTDVARTHPLLAWVVVRDGAVYPRQYAARLVTDAITPYVLLADTLEELRAKLPPGRHCHGNRLWRSAWRRVKLAA
jgi:hypothetical protein